MVNPGNIIILLAAVEMAIVAAMMPQTLRRGTRVVNPGNIILMLTVIEMAIVLSLMPLELLW